MRDTSALLKSTDFPAIRRRGISTLQMNLGYLCNLSCTHCHVSAGPKRTELMDRETMELALQVARHHNIHTLDVTGGSPEMNPHFRWLVTTAREQGLHVMDRCNPTILEEPGYEDTAAFLAEQEVEIVASLPCYMEDNVDAQRGKGVFQSSVNALQRLNELGYGKAGTGRVLNLVYNPVGAHLPPPQEGLQNDYRRFLGEQFDIVFNQLFALANMPIQRFGAVLLSKGQYREYMDLLKQSYRRENLEGVMCRDLISVDWRGFVYDCDFNQMLLMPAAGEQASHLSDWLERDPRNLPIAIGEHCYGCTAGQGSSCGGAL